jgi:hypothetical protein
MVFLGQIFVLLSQPLYGLKYARETKIKKKLNVDWTILSEAQQYHRAIKISAQLNNGTRRQI